MQSRIKLRKPKIRNKILDGSVFGLAAQEDFEIEIDPRQSAREYLNTLIHEMLHCFLPDLSERGILKMANLMEDAIWKRKYRRVKR